MSKDLGLEASKAFKSEVYFPHSDSSPRFPPMNPVWGNTSWVPGSYEWMVSANKDGQSRELMGRRSWVSFSY